MNGRSDDPLAVGAIALGGAISVALTMALFAASDDEALTAGAVPAPPAPTEAPAVPSAPAPPAPPPPPVARHVPVPPMEPYVPEPPVPPAPPTRFRPPVDYAPIPDFSHEGTILRLTVIPDVREVTPGAIRFAVIRADVAVEPPSPPAADPVVRERPPGR